jgi:hypothetical protein
MLQITMFVNVDDRISLFSIKPSYIINGIKIVKQISKQSTECLMCCEWVGCSGACHEDIFVSTIPLTYGKVEV